MAFRRVSPKEAHDLVRQDGWVYIDVRSEPEFEAGRPAGAVNVPLLVYDPARGGLRPNADFLAVMEASFGKDAKLVVGCQSGGRSQRACEVLEAAGYQHLVDQHAGFGGARDAFGRLAEPGWREAGLPVESGAGAPGQSYADLAKKR